MTSQAGTKTQIRPREITLTAVMTAATAVVTMSIVIPFAPTRGYFNLGDAIVMFSGLLLGARIGGFAGGVGSALADILSGFGYFAPFTLLIKGTEGFLVGLIGRSKSLSIKIAGVVAGALAMLVGYFSVETVFFGVGPALAELLAINSVQVTAGAIISIMLYQAVIRAYPRISAFAPQPERARSGLVVLVVAALLLALIVGGYLTTGISP